MPAPFKILGALHEPHRPESTRDPREFSTQSAQKNRWKVTDSTCLAKKLKDTAEVKKTIMHQVFFC